MADFDITCRSHLIPGHYFRVVRIDDEFITFEKHEGDTMWTMIANAKLQQHAEIGFNYAIPEPLKEIEHG